MVVKSVAWSVSFQWEVEGVCREPDGAEERGGAGGKVKKGSRVGE